MTEPEQNIDEQIREEIARVAQEAVEWKPSDGGKPAWKMRNARDFRVESKRIVPQQAQSYFDLQLSRGASCHETEDLQWQFEDPKLGTSTYLEKNRTRLSHLRGVFSLQTNDPLLELGSRSGHFLHYLQSERFTNLTGMDCVKLNVLWCRKNGFHVELGDAHALTQIFPSESFRAVFAYHVLEHCYDPEKVLRECHSILQPNGGLHIEIPIGRVDIERGHCYSFSRRELGRMLKRAGFRIMDYHHEGRFWAGVERVAARKES